jgi:hypothetical protein
MTTRQIATQLDDRANRMLRFHLTDGMAYDVSRGSAAMILDGQLVIGVDLDADGLPSRSIYVDPHHVTRIEVLDTNSRQPSDAA